MGGEGRVAVQYYSMQYILVLCEIKVRLLCVRLGCGLLLFLLGVAAGVGFVCVCVCVFIADTNKSSSIGAIQQE